MPTKKTDSGKEKKNSSQSQTGQASSSKKTASTEKQQKNGDVLDMNLAEGEIIRYFSWKRAGFILISSVVLIIILILGIVKGLSMWGEKRIEQNETFSQKIEQIENQIEKNKSEAEALFIFKKKLELANKLMNKHVYWTNFFDYLEGNTLEKVFYTGFQGNINGEYSIPTKTDDYSVINSQVKQMREKEETKSVEVRRATQSGEKENTEEIAGNRVGLKINLKVNKELFTK